MKERQVCQVSGCDLVLVAGSKQARRNMPESMEYNWSTRADVNECCRLSHGINFVSCSGENPAVEGIQVL